ncbi:HD family phosphohydrolase [Anthocerotibacter panamensis]|uniref:HD family phosphohydrolase n=1 Tax=Anthocerotibacter panamensis TaxID=2857077 RepID=UPI001C403D3A|nr:HDIG domain-containing metalloprotein [Anthocerotibacter panamensis]
MGLSFLGLSSLLCALGWRMVNEPQLTVGSFAPETILAPTDAVVIDQEATTVARENVRQQSIQIFQNLEDRNGRVLQRLEGTLQEGDGLFASLGALPYMNTALVSTAHQQALRALSSATWSALKANLSESDPPDSLDPDLIKTLERLSQNRPAPVVAEALAQIEEAQTRYRTAMRLLASAPASFTPETLELTPQQWEQVRQSSVQVSRQLLAVGIIPGLPEELRLRGINALIDPRINGISRRLITDLVSAVVEPNLKVDRFASLIATDLQAQSVSPVTIPIKQGQLLIQQGQPVTPRLFAILDQLSLTKRQVNGWGVFGLASLLLTMAMAFRWGQKLLQVSLQLKDLGLLQVLALTTALAGTLLPEGWSQLIPLALLGLLVGNYYGSRLGVLTVVCLTPPLLFSWSLTHPWTALLPIVSGGIVAAILVDSVRSRAQIALAGVGVATVQTALHLMLALWSRGWAGWEEHLALPALFYLGGGLLWSVVALGLSPYLETIFDVVTPVRLAELSNPNCGLLKRLVTEAPGTYQHTLFVANLATAAAQVLGDNADLVRVGTLYHDIGKMKRPQYFIENQMGLPNPHDQMDDPWHSTQIIRDHVTDGLKLAKQYKLPRVIRNFIPEHQGTILIAYFYHQAKQSNEREVHEEDFRYSGPTPQSRETGLVMLADACEAALRSLNNAPGSDPYGMVRRIIQARWAEGQLADSGLKEHELDTIACTFIKVWKETNHRRIRYPNQPGGVELRRRNLASQSA